MKKLAAVTSLTTFLASAVSAFAQNTPGTGRITIRRPDKGYSDLGEFITAAINFVFIIAAIAVLIMLVWGAVQWIFSGGEKDAVASARNRILHALIGLAVLAVAFAVAVVFGQFVGINLFDLVIPQPGGANPIQQAPPVGGTPPR
jgi:hypothetical protein